jgi:outer membrane protein TolC
VVAALVYAGSATAGPLTADSAVVIALKQSPSVILAKADVLSARASLYSSYSGVLPSVSLGIGRSVSRTEKSQGSQVFGNAVVPSSSDLSETYSTNPVISGTWSILDLANLKGMQSARHGMRAAQLGEKSTRQLAVLDVKRQFYVVVQQVRLALVADAAIKLARDNERRVRALFEVGSVARNDLLRARVSTSQSELDSLTAHQQVVVQRDLLASLLGIPEAQMGEVDTALVVAPHTYDPAVVLDEASKQRPDILASEAELSAARSGLTSANFARLPYVTLSGSAAFNPYSSNKTITSGDTTFTSHSSADRGLSGRVALNWDIFTGFATESRIANARARVVRAEENRNALRRNLTAEVNETLISYEAAVEGDRVSADAFDSAVENLKLIQQKYNVGSATILDLIDAQVQATRAAADRQRTLAAIRVAEAQVDRVRGTGD